MTRAVLGYVVIAALVAGAVVTVGVWLDRVSPAAPSAGAPSADASSSAFAEAEPSIREAAPTVVVAIHAPSRATEKPGSEIVPWLNPLPPLLDLILSTESPAVRRAAEELNHWLTLTVGAGVKPCFARQPPQAVWAEFFAELDRGDGPSVKVSQLRLARIHGDYVISPEEAACFAENLRAITGHGVSEEAAEALAPYFPMDHRFAFEFPCGTCTAR